jgi:acyl-CoA synthetase (AMP-forming)/AMP-acid ligase II
VVALPHPEWINVLGATVVPEDGEQLDGADVKGHVADRLPGYMVPAEVRIVADLPKGSSGKIDRSRIRDELLAGPAGS